MNDTREESAPPFPGFPGRDKGANHNGYATSPPGTDNGKTILVSDDDQAIRFVLEQALSRAGYTVKSFPDGDRLVRHLQQNGGDLVITDIVMPGGSGLDLLKNLKRWYPYLPVIVITAQSTLNNAVTAFERGAFEYLAKPFDINKLVQLVQSALKRHRSARQKASPASSESSSNHFGGFIGSSRAVQELFRTIGRLSNTEMTVLIHGESGTGKELVARAVHTFSPRRDGPFTAINMAAIPRNLIESELFGHEKGAFTGAVGKRRGHFESTKGGTLFLDEIGDMPMEAQTRLLRVLQDGTFTRVGSAETLRSNVRIVAATHQNLPEAITQGRFREDLFYRLNVIPLHVPPLRGRKDDILPLVEHFLIQASQELGIPPKRFTTAALEKLMSHDWPGNVRELENLVHRLMVLVPEALIEADALALHDALAPREERSPGESHPSGGAPGPTTPHDEAGAQSAIAQVIIAELDRHFSIMSDVEITGLYQTILRQVEKPMIDRVLRQTRGNRIRAARIMGINRNTLRKKMENLAIEAKPKTS